MPTEKEARLNLCVSADVKRTIEAAAMQLGQTVSDFAVSTLAQAARQIIQEHHVTRLTLRDWEILNAIIDDTSAAPNEALAAGARRYNQMRQRKKKRRCPYP